MTAAQVPQEIYLHFTENILDDQIKALIKAMAEFSNQGVQRVVLCLATDGGNIASGIQLYNVLRAMPSNSSFTPSETCRQQATSSS